jgi:hypothetical protein
MPTGYLPTPYKARRVPTKQAVCAICVERTRGKTKLVELGYGVSVHLCVEHASHGFQTQRGGRDFVLTLQRLWHAHGCLTVAGSNALRRHLAAGRPALTVSATLRAVHADGPATPPSLRTMRRWCTERRWLARTPRAAGPAP